ncbi:starch synthase 3, chloroplastic/amyloplastic-like [Chenopodium quinoa]|uniref:starch synthase n=2 Tax=Chenopodium quinoa TaxID=63459 RepID=A0A803M1W1_CHEQI|nr:starch synthase 3, chloroplastic/amyloplastic-like [Chenopodium quinoa]
MEVSGLQSQRPVWCSQSFIITRQNSHLNFRPFTGLVPCKSSYRSFHSYSRRLQYPRNGNFRPCYATGEFSKKKQKKWSRPKGSAPKGFVPKAPVGTSTPKRDQTDEEDNSPSVDSSPELGKRASDVGSSAEKTERSEVSQVNRIGEQREDLTNGKAGKSTLTKKAVTNGSKNLLKEIDTVTGFIGEGRSSTSDLIDETGLEPEDLESKQGSSTESNVLESEKIVSGTGIIDENEKDKMTENEALDLDRGGSEIFEDMASENKQSNEDRSEAETRMLVSENKVSDLTPYEKKVEDIVSVQENISLISYPSVESDKNVTDSEVLPGSETLLSNERETKELDSKEFDDESVTETEVVGSSSRAAITTDEKKLEEALRKLQLEMEALERQKVLEEMAEHNFSKGTKVFIYPETAKPDQDIELFLNRSLSPLKDEPNVMVMGAFNDWRWKSFTTKLQKSHLRGDWWSCQIHVPKEAYKMEFIFFNGQDVYDNNDKKDFHIIVEGGMDLDTFEDFLLEEKRREQENLAKVEAERKRQAEEQRQREEERAASEADRAQAKAEVEKRKEKLRELVKKAVSSMNNVWFFEPLEFKDGDLVRLYYNKSSGPLVHANDVWIHGGHDNWSFGLSVVARLVKSEEKEGDWWYAEVTVPDQAVVLDWVFADGPPQKASIYDNNKRQDFHAVVPKSVPNELYWVEEELRIYQRLQEDRRAKQEALRAKAEKTARMKAETKEKTLKTFLLSQRHIVYTDPVDVKAGQDVTVYYNPSNTVLNGKPEVWFRGSFNQWTHRRGPLPPQKMYPAENGTHVKTTVKVPLDAYMMDFVFSEWEDGGIFDNKFGMDYHVPVFGGIAKEPPMHIVHIAVEMAPIAKVGGLGDVVTSLSRAVQDLNHHVDVILPKYQCLNLNHVKDFHHAKSYSWGGTEIKVWFGKVEGLSVHFLEPLNGLLQTNSVYIGKNDGERFGFFCHAALEYLLQSGFHPDIIHCHDWSSAPVAWLYKEHYGQYGLTNARVVFTIHNLEFGAYFIGRAMEYADKATTVSNTYAKEVAGNPAIAPHLYKFHGILNGIDPDIWDPFNDKFIPVNYTSENVAEGKKAAKEALQQRFSIKKGDFPLVGIITRLTHQKGIHLIKHAIWRTIERGGQVVLLGSAPDPRIQQEFVDVANRLHNMHHDRAGLCLNYDEPLSHLIYAGADLILVPSIFEPCGLTQLVAMRYGSIPVVRKTGGLHDTVFDVDHDVERARAQGLEPNGFNFEGADPAGVDYALDRAISAWYDAKEWFNTLRKRVMEQDWSWNRPALEYMELYHAAWKN